MPPLSWTLERLVGGVRWRENRLPTLGAGDLEKEPLLSSPGSETR
jgi:hypothetical protein